MEDAEKKKLVIKHAQLAAALASGYQAAGKEMATIEAKLRMKPDEIMQLAIQEYNRDY